MDTHVALADVASGRAREIRAEYGSGIHNRPPGVAGEHSQEEYGWTPIFVTSAPHHGLVESYRANWAEGAQARRCQDSQRVRRSRRAGS